MSAKKTVEQCIEKSEQIHGKGKYDYSLFTEYKNNKIAYPIRCIKHNYVFYTTMNDHLGKKRCGCSKCGLENRVGRKSERTYQSLCEEVDNKFGKSVYTVLELEREDYPGHLYVDVICNTDKSHGVFKKEIHELLRIDKYITAGGCPKCKIKQSRLGTNEKLKLLEIRKTQTNYDYSLVDISSIRTLTDKVKIICPIHSVFEQAFDNHFKYNHNCPKCKHTYTTEEIDEILNSFENLNCSFKERVLIYAKDSKLVKDLTIENIKCLKHNTYFSKSYSALKSQNCCSGCSECISETVSLSLRSNTPEFIEKAEDVHGIGKFIYDNVQYVNSVTPVKIGCREHGVFWQAPATHLTSKLCCPICVRRISSSELEVLDFIKTLISETDIETNKRYSWLNKKELDIYIPKYNLAVEYNGSAFHHSSKSEFISSFKKQTSKPPTYHFDKWKMCFDNNITLLSIYDFYWADENKKEIIKSKIRHYLGLDKKIYARKTYIKQIDNSVAYKFYHHNHLEGKGMAYKNSKSYGLYDKENNTLLMCATVGEIYNQSSKSFKTKLHRICTLLDHTVVGGISKLSKHIKTDLNSSFTYQITLSSGGTSLKSASSYKILPPRYFWIKPETFVYHHRNYCQKQVLEKHFDVPLLEEDTENTYMERLGYLKVYDNGLAEIQM